MRWRYLFGRLCAVAWKDSPYAKLHGQRSGDGSELRASAADARTRDMQACFGFDLESLLEHARTHEWTPEERIAQVISFAYGNVKLHNPAITREDVERIYEQLIPVTA